MWSKLLAWARLLCSWKHLEALLKTRYLLVLPSRECLMNLLIFENVKTSWHHLEGENQKLFPVKSGLRQGHPFYHFYPECEVLPRAARQARKELQDREPDRRGEVHILLQQRDSYKVWQMNSVSCKIQKAIYPISSIFAEKRKKERKCNPHC